MQPISAGQKTIAEDWDLYGKSLRNSVRISAAGIAKAIIAPTLPVLPGSITMVVIPSTRLLLLSKGPPLHPWLIAQSFCRNQGLSPFFLTELIEPLVMVRSKLLVPRVWPTEAPRGNPAANTGVPMSCSFEICKTGYDFQT